MIILVHLNYLLLNLNIYTYILSSNNKTVVNKLIKHWDTCEKQTIILFSYNKYNRYTLLIYTNQTVFNVHYMNHECSIFKSIRFIESGNVAVKYSGVSVLSLLVKFTLGFSWFLFRFYHAFFETLRNQHTNVRRCP